METITPVADGTRTENGPPRNSTERERYIDGLRVLVAVLEQNEDIPPPIQGLFSTLVIMFLGKDEDIRERMAAAARAFPCSWEKRVSGGGELAEWFDLLGTVGGLKVELTAPRGAVCKRVVTGTEDREVDEVVTPAVTRKVTKPVDIIEWDCGSLLAPRPVTETAPKAVAAA
jgi:hypothetical protein